MAPVAIRVEGSLDKALRIFKKKCIDAGIYNELKRIAFYEKPSEIKRKQEIKKEKTIRNATRKRSSSVRRPLRRKPFMRRRY